MLIDLGKTLWAFRAWIATLFAAVFLVDLLLGSLRFLLIQAGLFVAGVLIGRYRRPKALSVRERSVKRG